MSGERDDVLVVGQVEDGVSDGRSPVAAEQVAEGVPVSVCLEQDGCKELTPVASLACVHGPLDKGVEALVNCERQPERDLTVGAAVKALAAPDRVSIFRHVVPAGTLDICLTRVCLTS